MNTAPASTLLDYIASGCSEVLSRVATKVQDYEDARRKARHANREEPRKDLPSVARGSWVSWASGILDESGGVPVWIRNQDLVAGFEDLAGPVLNRLRPLPEFSTWAAQVIEVRWTRRPIVVRDMVLTEALAGRVKAVSIPDRLLWTGQGPAPAFRLELSLPWWLLADDDEQERGLHHLLAYCGMETGDRPVLRKADIVAHASTLARFGVGGVRQAMAVAHAQAHPTHERLLREYGFDPASGQGMLWQEHRLPRQANLLELAKDTAKRRKSKPPAAVVTDLEDDDEDADALGDHGLVVISPETLAAAGADEASEA